MAPYYANASTELIFHVSTLLDGDVTQKLKHLGNDEVHVVWSEHPKYRREWIATRFCDVLIVLYPVSEVLVRVRIEMQDAALQFGPLFDGMLWEDLFPYLATLNPIKFLQALVCT